MRKNALTLAVISLAAGGLAACGGSGSGSGSGSFTSDSTEDPSAQVRVVHASSNAPDVDVGLNGETAVSALAFGDATDYLEVEPGTFAVTVDAILPDGVAEVISADVDLDAEVETTILAVGNVGGSGELGLAPLVITAPAADPAADEVRVQVVHASATAEPAGSLDVYVTSPGADLAASEVEPVGAFGFREDLGPVTIDAGTYRIRVTPEGDSGTVVFDSGEVDLAGGLDLVISAIDSVGPDDSPVRLLVAPEGGDAFTILDTGTGTQVGAAHLSENTPEVNVVLDGDFGSPAFSDLAFPSVTNFADIPAGTYDIDVAATGSPMASAVGATDVELAAGERYTGYAIGRLGGDPELELIFSQDAIRSVATEARLRVIHAASLVPGDNGEVDIYLTPEGTMEGDLASLDPAVADFPYREISEFLAVVPGTYEVYVTVAGSSDAAIGPVTVDLEAGDVQTAIARDDEGGFAILPVDETAR